MDNHKDWKDTDAMQELPKQLRGLSEYFDRMAEQTEKDDDDIYSCPICRDCGWIVEGGIARPCSCQKAEEHKLNRLPVPHLRQLNFDGFDLRLYPEMIRTERGKSYRDVARVALREAKDFSESICRGINRPGLIFEGEVGSGKTFLAAAIANDLLAHDVDVEFVVVPEFLDQLRNTYHNESGDGSELVERVRTVPVLILDDMGAHNFSPWVQNILFTVLNYRLNHMLPVIITTNLSLDELESAVGERIVSRMMEIGTIVKLFVDKDIRMQLFKNGRNTW